MAVKEVEHSGSWFLECDECPEKPVYTESDEFNEFGANWNKSCFHIEAVIEAMDDGGSLAGGNKYQFNLSPVASFLCRDPWALWVTVKVGPSMLERGGMMQVTFEYDSEFFQKSSGDLGWIMPEDGRESIRMMMWDWLTNELLKRQPEADKGKFNCPVRTHGVEEARMFGRDVSEQISLNAQIACIVLENCCTHCYRKTMGQDGGSDFGMGGVQTGSGRRPNQPRAPRPGSQSSGTPAGSGSQGSPRNSSNQGSTQTVTSTPSGLTTTRRQSYSGSSQVPLPPSVPGSANAAPPPWETNSA